MGYIMIYAIKHVNFRICLESCTHKQTIAMQMFTLTNWNSHISYYSVQIFFMWQSCIAWAQVPRQHNSVAPTFKRVHRFSHSPKICFVIVDTRMSFFSNMHNSINSNYFYYCFLQFGRCWVMDSHISLLHFTTHFSSSCHHNLSVTDPAKSSYQLQSPVQSLFSISQLYTWYLIPRHATHPSHHSHLKFSYLLCIYGSSLTSIHHCTSHTCRITLPFN